MPKLVGLYNIISKEIIKYKPQEMMLDLSVVVVEKRRELKGKMVELWRTRQMSVWK